MTFDGPEAFVTAHRAALLRRPLALVLAEDGVELGSTLNHLAKLGFGLIGVLCGESLPWPEEAPANAARIRWDIFAEEALVTAVNRVSALLPGAWIHFCHNAEYLFYPFCETRSIADVATFQTEERRDTLFTPIVDLYAGDFSAHPDGVSRSAALLDSIGYYALAREDPTRGWQVKERQIDLYGGLRWRFEEHVPWTRRRIDRVSFFRARPGLELRGDFTFTIEEYNTLACPWHHNLSGAVCSFRTAKALRINPGSREAIPTFAWSHSVPFSWGSRQLLDLGLMEPGQWF